MKLLILTWNYPPTIGGIEQVAFQLADGLRRLGDEIEVIAAAAPGSTGTGLEHDRHIFRAKKSGMLSFTLHGIVKGWQRARATRPDLIICPSLTSAPAARVVSMLTRIPFCILIHGSDVLVPSRPYQWLIRGFMRSAGLLFANSQHTARLIEQKGHPTQKIRVVNPGVTPPPAITHPPQPATIQLLEKIKGRPTLLTVGRLVKRKGILEFIRFALPGLVKKFPDLVYLVVGEEPKSSLIHHERILDTLKTAIEQGNHQQRVHLLGRLPDADLRLVYAHTDLFVLPCLNDANDIEGFGIVILEAAWHSVPSVATRTGGIPDAIDDGVTGVLTTPGNYNELIDTIGLILADSSRKSSLGQKARERASGAFTWQSIASRYREHMVSLIS